jgi:osmotically-inducible protein OsmY
LKALKNDLITVTTIQGEVTLSGTVSSDASRELAEWTVSHVPGVTTVHNNLRLRQDDRSIPQ